MENSFNYPNNQMQCVWCGSKGLNSNDGKWIDLLFCCGTSYHPKIKTSPYKWVQSCECRIQVMEFRLAMLSAAFEHDTQRDEKYTLDACMRKVHNGEPLSQVEPS